MPRITYSLDVEVMDISKRTVGLKFTLKCNGAEIPILRDSMVVSERDTITLSDFLVLDFPGD